MTRGDLTDAEWELIEPHLPLGAFGLDTLMTDAGIKVVTTGIQMPRMNSLMERWIQTCRRELLDRTLVWNQRHVLHALCVFETHYNEHRPHRALAQAARLSPLPQPGYFPPATSGHERARPRPTPRRHRRGPGREPPASSKIPDQTNVIVGRMAQFQTPHGLVTSPEWRAMGW